MELLGVEQEIGPKILTRLLTMEIGQTGMCLLTCNGLHLAQGHLLHKHMFLEECCLQRESIMEFSQQQTNAGSRMLGAIGRQMSHLRLVLQELTLSGKFIGSFPTI